MNSYYQTLRVVAAVLLCALLQQCTRDIPTPAPAPKSTTRESTLTNKSAAGFARQGLAAQPETIKVAALPAPKWSAGSTAAARLATCFDYYEVCYTNGVETSRTFLYKVCGGDGDGGSGSGSGSGEGSGSPGGDGTGTTSGLSANTVLVTPPDIPVNDIHQCLKCFNASQGATFTV